MSKVFTILCKNDNWFILSKLRPDVVGDTVQLTIKAFILTNSGAELYDVIDHDKPVDLNEICRFLGIDSSLCKMRVEAKGYTE